MCYSAKTSLISYTIGIISGIFAICTRQVALGIFIIAYSQIQLSEFLIWSGIDDNNIELNKFGTSFGKYLLATHNIALGIGIILSIIYISKRNLTLTDFIPLLLGILLFLYVVIFVYLPNNFVETTFPIDPTCTQKNDRCQNNNNRLDWPYEVSWYLISFVMTLTICYFYVKPYESKWWFMFAYFIMFILVVLMDKTHRISSIWCFSAAILAPIIVIVNYYLIKDLKSEDILT